MRWPTDRLSRLADVWPSNVDKHSIEGQQSVRLCNYTDVYKNPSINGAMAFMPATATSEQIERFRLVVGDTLITKDSETADDIGIPAFVEYEAPDLICGYHLAIVRPDLSVAAPRFIYWALSSEFVRRQWSVLASGVTRVALRSADLSRVQVPYPPLELQRAIADYLDRETGQIDTIIAKQEQLIATLREREASVLDFALVAAGLRTVPQSLTGNLQKELPSEWRVLELGQTLEELTNGFVGPTRDILVENGVRYIQSTHIKNGAIDFARRPFFVDADWHAQRPRIHLREGDILIVQTGDIGKVAVVPMGFGEASCHALQIARVRRSIVMPQYLGAYLASVFGYHQLRSRATGALHPHLEAGIRALPVIVPPLEVQSRVLAEVNRDRSMLQGLIAKAERFIELAKERRGALITAAVTGQINVRAA